MDKQDLQPDATTLAAWRKATNWRRENATDIFPTQSSFDWFLRHHGTELISAGELIPGVGRRGHLVGPNIDSAVINILRREAGQRSGGNHGL
jgi:hypothetical protein